ncbi:MAG: 1-acyl-sn-glycerol-3-phosphate acyltransferase [Candidatus Koribacter versatilis]|nr:1-acyl-sn-glycerol-3-phosphate acyltransferase [Candidatus Koribacter versatilis]
MKTHPLAGIIAGAARLISGVNVRWVDSEPDARQTVYFANHTSHLDFVVLWSSLPAEIRARTRPVAAQDYWEKGLSRTIAVNVFRAVLVARHQSGQEKQTAGDPRQAIEHMVDAMGSENSLILFPEGTRGTGEDVGGFKSGLYYLCQRKPGIRLVPAFLNNLNRILPKGEFLPVPFISQLTFGPALALAAEESKAAFLARARAALCRLREI